MKKNLKKILTTTLVVGLFATSTVYAATISKTLQAYYRDIKIYVDSKLFKPVDVNGNSVEPFIVNNSTYLPLRAVSEAVGCEIGWDDKTNTITVKTGAITANSFTFGNFGLYDVSIVGGKVNLTKHYINKPVISAYKLSDENYVIATITDEQFKSGNLSNINNFTDGKLLQTIDYSGKTKTIIDTRTLNKSNGYSLDGIYEITGAKGDEIFFKSAVKSEKGTTNSYYEYSVNTKTNKITVLNYVPGSNDEGKYAPSKLKEYVAQQVANQQAAIDGTKPAETFDLIFGSEGLTIDYKTGDNAGKKTKIYSKPVLSAIKISNDQFAILTVTDAEAKKVQNGSTGFGTLAYQEGKIIQIIDKNGNIKEEVLNITKADSTLKYINEIKSCDDKTVVFTRSVSVGQTKYDTYTYSYNRSTKKITVTDYTSDVYTLGYFSGNTTEFNKYIQNAIASEQGVIDNKKPAETYDLVASANGLVIEYKTGDNAGTKTTIFTNPVLSAVKVNDDLFAIFTVSNDEAAKIKATPSLYNSPTTCILKTIDKTGAVKSEHMDIMKLIGTATNLSTPEIGTFDGKNLSFIIPGRDDNDSNKDFEFTYNLEVNTKRLIVRDFYSEFFTLEYFKGIAADFNEYKEMRISDEQTRVGDYYK